MRTLNQEHIRLLGTASGEVPYYKLLGMKVVEVGMGYSVMEAELDEKLDNGSGIVHGGAYASLLDCAAWWAAYGNFEENENAVTLDLKIDYLKPALPGAGKMIAKGRLINSGRTICFSEAQCLDEQGRVLAHAKAKLFVTARNGSNSENYQKMTGKVAPPKFIEE